MRATRACARFVAGSLGGLVAVVLVAVSLPLAAGWRPMTVMSGSMAPAIATADVVVARPIAPESARIGDVVTFDDPSRGGLRLTHRVRSLEVHGALVSVTTRGDANTGEERWSVAASGRIGRVAYRIPQLGRVTSPLQSGIGRIGVLVVPALLLALLELRRVWTAPAGPDGRRA